MTAREIILISQVYVRTDDASSTGWYWFKHQQDFASEKETLDFFFSGKAQRHGPFKTQKKCDTHQEKTMRKELGRIEEGGTFVTSRAIN